MDVYMYLVYAIVLFYIFACLYMVLSIPLTYCLSRFEQEEQDTVICNYECYSTAVV